MKRPQQIISEEKSMATLFTLTGAFEGIASMRIAQIKNQVLQSQQFFSELWHIYRQIADAGFNFGRGSLADSMSKPTKNLFLAVTAEGGFSGDIDQKLISWMLQNYDPKKHDIMVIGHHGALQLSQLGIGFKKYFKLPSKDTNIDVSQIAKEIQAYKETTIYYQTYVSLMVQDIKRIELGSAIEQQGKNVRSQSEIIDEKTYIFEPSTRAVVDHIENSMTQIAISQVILESKLAQYASRFRAMSQARHKADDMLSDIRLKLYQSKRAMKDERLKEIINGLKKAKVA